MKEYLFRWRKFHQHWLINCTSSVKVVLYNNLVQDIREFTKIAEFFGYTAESTTQRFVEHSLKNLND